MEVVVPVAEAPEDPSSSGDKELKTRRNHKRSLSTYYTVTSNNLSGNNNIRRTKSLSGHDESSESGSTSSSKHHFYQKNGATVVYFSDEHLIGAVENAATTLTSALQHHSHQASTAPSIKQQLKREIEATTQDEQCHQRRFMAQEAMLKRRASSIDHALWQGQERLAKALKIKRAVYRELMNRVNEALRASQMMLTLNAFVLFRDDHTYEPVNDIMYESMQNDYEHRIITLQELMSDVMRVKKPAQEELFKEILHTCFFLEDPARPLNYMIYKREIVFVGDKPLESTTPLWARWFLPHRGGYYYAIIVNFALSKRSVYVKPPEIAMHAFNDEDKRGHISTESAI